MGKNIRCWASSSVVSPAKFNPAIGVEVVEIDEPEFAVGEEAGVVVGVATTNSIEPIRKIARTTACTSGTVSATASRSASASGTANQTSLRRGVARNGALMLAVGAPSN